MLAGSTHVGTKDYMAPEMLLEVYHIDVNLDMWSVGCIAASLICRHRHSIFDKSEERVRAGSYYLQLIAILQIIGIPSKQEKPEIHHEVGLIIRTR